jgi:hypothetical protein
MNVEIGTEGAQFPEKKYINEIFFSVRFRKGVFEGKYYFVKTRKFSKPT